MGQLGDSDNEELGTLRSYREREVGLHARDPNGVARPPSPSWGGGAQVDAMVHPDEREYLNLSHTRETDSGLCNLITPPCMAARRHSRTHHF